MTALPLDTLARSLASSLRNHEPVDDYSFDRLLPAAPREKSARFWSPVQVAQVTAAWLAEHQASRLLDVGAGIGKFSSVASLWSGHRVWGLERRGSLILEARKLAQRLGAEVVIVEGTLEAIDPGEFDAFYFYNPFAEHVLRTGDCYDLEFERSPEQYVQQLRTVEGWLENAVVGTTMVTYNGLGGRIPSSWSCLRRSVLNGNVLRLWRKTASHSVREDAWVEVNDVVLTSARLANLLKVHPASELDEVLMLSRLVLSEP